MLQKRTKLCRNGPMRKSDPILKDTVSADPCLILHCRHCCTLCLFCKFLVSPPHPPSLLSSLVGRWHSDTCTRHSLRCSQRWWHSPVTKYNEELSTNVHEVSQCPDKGRGHLLVEKLLKTHPSAFTLSQSFKTLRYSGIYTRFVDNSYPPRQSCSFPHPDPCTRVAWCTPAGHRGTAPGWNTVLQTLDFRSHILGGRVRTLGDTLGDGGVLIRVVIVVAAGPTLCRHVNYNVLVPRLISSLFVHGCI